MVAQFFETAKHLAEILQKAFGADVHDQGDAAPARNRRGLHVQKRLEQAQGQVVDAKIADIFQGAQHRTLPRTGKPGEDENGKRGQVAVVRFRVRTWFRRHFSPNLAS